MEGSGADRNSRSLTAWAEHILTETGELAELPQHLRYYFDYEAYARDCRLGGEILDNGDG